MPTPQELETKFWQALKSDMTMMVGLDGVEDGHARPMTAQVDGERGPIWLFTAKDSHDFAHRGLLEWLSNTPLPPLSGPSG